ncbi:conserved hypothetical protein [Xenorhabdus bovienii str. oregonense]|uniref:Uncharacterized protein n=1 Tax=Xenorhabdus bovienii str. oregonense TaxID=1398202 RepID=A0A077P7J2_XENBV|nr:hypothetical protein [Xenorhabdus bovienii]CDH06829.1 conserved hypothetical protein [Xenorhabdus bovienii str. oregonense]
MTDNIITLKFGDDSKPSISTSVTPKTPEQSRCQHGAITVDEQYRVITCDQCGCNIEAFDYLLERARGGERVVREIETLYQRRDELRTACDKLQREEKNTKVRLRGAKTQLQFLENDIKKVNNGG